MLSSFFVRIITADKSEVRITYISYLSDLIKNSCPYESSKFLCLPAVPHQQRQPIRFCPFFSPSHLISKNCFYLIILQLTSLLTYISVQPTVTIIKILWNNYAHFLHHWYLLYYYFSYVHHTVSSLPSITYSPLFLLLVTFTCSSLEEFTVSAHYFLSSSI